MKKLLYIFFMIYTIICPTFAVEIRALGNRVSLIGNYDEVEAQARFIWNWYYRVERSNPTRIPAPRNEGRQCVLDVTPWLPREARALQGRVPVHDGPNCWNTSLLLSGLQEFSRYTHWDEFSEVLSSRCQAITNRSDLIPGDVIAIRQRNRSGGIEEYHGFTWLSDEITFSKNGFYRGNAYSLQTFEGVMNFYATPMECIEVRNRERCPRWVEFYRCDDEKESSDNRGPFD